MEIQDVHKVYFLGIGGIGMSALALYFLHKGCEVWGYDKVRTPLTQKLEEAGAQIHYTEAPDLIPAYMDMVVYTPAVPQDHKEWPALKALGVPIYKRAQVLGACTEGYKNLAVAGSHGKTTTSSLIAFLLYETLGCHAFLGGIANNYGTNFLYTPGSKWMVTEADEYDRSFLQLHPLYSVVTSMDPDHLDVYGDVENMRQAYLEFMGQTNLKQGGVVLKSSLKKYVGDLPLYRSYHTNLNQDTPHVYARNMRVEEDCYLFDYVCPEGVLENLRMSYPGRHNVENALAAITVALAVGVSKEDIRYLLPLFKGVKRRFDVQVKNNHLCYVDDYAHHPGEICACLSTLKELYPRRKIRLVFQPHLYSRTRDLAEEFALSMSVADEIVLIDIYPARELPLPGVDCHLIGDKIQGKKIWYTPLEKAMDLLASLPEPELIVSMGAGNIDTLVEPIRKLYTR